MSDSCKHCWIRAWHNGRYVLMCINCAMVKE